MVNNKKYGIAVAISMVVGIVIGSGVFFKSSEILEKSGGDFKLALLAWIVGGIAMTFGALTIANFAQKVSNSNGLIDYFEYAFSGTNIGKYNLGQLTGYLIGWFTSVIYFPALIAIVAWVCGGYIIKLIDPSNSYPAYSVWLVSIIVIMFLYLLVIVSRSLSSKLQVSTTVIKLIPLIAIGIVGLFLGFKNGTTMSYLDTGSWIQSSSGSLSIAVVTVMFSFDGWFIATSINDELKDSKRDLPRALLFGSLIIFTIYVVYFIAVTSTLGPSETIKLGQNVAIEVAKKFFGAAGGTILTVFVIISCLGTVNGLIMASSRSFYQMALRGNGFAPKQIVKIDKRTDSPINSSLVSLVLSLLMLFIWFGNFNLWKKYFVDISELPIVMLYVGFAILYLVVIFKFKELSFVKRFVFPIIAFLGACIILYGGITNPRIGLYLLVSFLIIASGIIFFRPQAQQNQQ